eukprot:GHVS01096075.1.p1 GENE.GHVS01096075.1~~GHVS01096075.1.p1  ORF type:complete len:150 (+),score=14.82 GHVS01096075.1:219-668(+)
MVVSPYQLLHVVRMKTRNKLRYLGTTADVCVCVQPTIMYNCTYRYVTYLHVRIPVVQVHADWDMRMHTVYSVHTLSCTLCTQCMYTVYTVYIHYIHSVCTDICVNIKATDISNRRRYPREGRRPTRTGRRKDAKEDLLKEEEEEGKRME